MEAAQTSAPENQTPSAPEGARRCLVVGELLPKEDLIRFVVSPDNQVVPDLAQNLPGRGMWVTTTRDAITTAAKTNLFSKAAKTSVKADVALVDQIVALTRRRALDFLGLARRSGIAVLGQPQVEGELKNGRLAMIFLADDASGDLSSFRNFKDMPVSRHFNRNELGSALGHDQLVYIGLKGHVITQKLREEIARLEKLTETPHIS